MIIRMAPPGYQAFMLRCWRVRSQEPLCLATWQFSLEDPHTGKGRGFADLDALIDFIRGEVIKDAIG